MTRIISTETGEEQFARVFRWGIREFIVYVSYLLADLHSLEPHKVVKMRKKKRKKKENLKG